MFCIQKIKNQLPTDIVSKMKWDKVSMLDFSTKSNLCSMIRTVIRDLKFSIHVNNNFHESVILVIGISVV